MKQAPSELSAFCEAQWPRLVGSLYLLTGNLEVAKDLAQETLARICRDWRRVARMDAPGPWTQTVAVNLARSYFRRRAAARNAEAKLLARNDRGSDDADFTDALAIRTAIGKLPERQRVALVLRYYADLPVHAVAEAMHCPEGTVKTLTREAILALRAEGLVQDRDENELNQEPFRDAT